MMRLCPFCGIRGFIDTVCPICGSTIHDIELVEEASSRDPAAAERLLYVWHTSNMTDEELMDCMKAIL